MYETFCTYYQQKQKVLVHTCLTDMDARLSSARRAHLPIHDDMELPIQQRRRTS